jgi:hypothetical protein
LRWSNLSPLVRLAVIAGSPPPLASSREPGVAKGAQPLTPAQRQTFVEILPAYEREVTAEDGGT